MSQNCLLKGLGDNVTNFLGDVLSNEFDLQKNFYQNSDSIFETPFKMYNEIKDLLDGPDIRDIGNIFTKAGPDMVEGPGLDLANGSLYSSAGLVNPITYKIMCKKIQILRQKLKLRETFKNVPDRDIRILITNPNKDVFFDSAKLKDSALFLYDGNEGLNIPGNATAKFNDNKINENHVGRFVFTNAEISKEGFAVTTNWSGTLKRQEHRVCKALRNNKKNVVAIIAISIPDIRD
jgi:hypothetical protein